MNFASKTLAAAALVVAGAAPAFAVPIGLTESFATAGGNANADYSPHNSGFSPTLFNATSLNSGDGYVISGLAGGAAGANGDTVYFTAANFALQQTFNNGSVAGGNVNVSNFQVAWDSRYYFTPTSATYTASTNGTASTIGVLFVGTFSDTGGTYATQNASFTETYSQSGPSAVSFGANFSTAPNPVPEPVSMGLMALGLVGLAAARRRSTNAI